MKLHNIKLRYELHEADPFAAKPKTRSLKQMDKLLKKYFKKSQTG